MNNRNICTICYLNNSTIGCTKCNYKICTECSNKLKKNECPGCRNPDKEWRKNLETNKVIINITEEFPENIEITESYIQPNMNYNENLENSIINLRYFNCVRTIPILNDEEIEERIYIQNKCKEIINYIIKIKIKVLLILLICLILGFITTIWSGTDYKYILKYNYNMILMLLILRGLIFIVSMLILMIICIIIENKTGFLSKLKNCLYSGPGDA